MKKLGKYVVEMIAIGAIGASIFVVGCQKTTLQGNNQNQTNRPINFAPYIPSQSTKGAVVNNSTLTNNGFNVTVYKMSADKTTAEKYLSKSHVVHSAGYWGYTDEMGDPINRYWPADNSRLSFLAHYPTQGPKITDDGKTPLFGGDIYDKFDASNNDNDLAFKFNYTVHHDAKQQYDLIYALRENVLCPDQAPYSVHLPFCHALTQIAFTAQKDSKLTDLNFKLYDIVLHNLAYTGTFAVKNSTGDDRNDYFDNNGVWWFAKLGDNPFDEDDNQNTNSEGYLISECDAIVRQGSKYGMTSDLSGNKYFADGIDITTTSAPVSDPKNELMLMPQYISAWNPDTYISADTYKAGAYLAVSCEITQTIDGRTITIHNKENWLYIPLTTAIDYGTGAPTNEWLAGYKITYNLIFGGGYTTIPGTKDPVKTLSPITITATANDWIEIDPDIPLTL